MPGQPDGESLIDLGIFLGGWSGDVGTAAANVQQGLASVVAYKVAGAARTVSTGLSIYLPRKGRRTAATWISTLPRRRRRGRS